MSRQIEIPVIPYRKVCPLYIAILFYYIPMHIMLLGKYRIAGFYHEH